MKRLKNLVFRPSNFPLKFGRQLVTRRILEFSLYWWKFLSPVSRTEVYITACSQVIYQEKKRDFGSPERWCAFGFEAAACGGSQLGWAVRDRGFMNGRWAHGATAVLASQRLGGSVKIMDKFHRFCLGYSRFLSEAGVYYWRPSPEMPIYECWTGCTQCSHPHWRGGKVAAGVRASLLPFLAATPQPLCTRLLFLLSSRDG